MSAPPPSVEERWAMLARITCPTLLIRGADRDLLSGETAERMARTIPNCRLVEVAGSNHPVPFDNPQGFRRVVDEFLEPQRTSGSAP
jgi:esterase